MTDYDHLLSPFSIGGVRLRNRVVMLPMTTGFCESDGSVGQRLVDFFAARAAGGAGLIIAPFTPLKTGAVVDAGLFADRFVEPARRLTESVHKNGAAISAQLIVTYGLVTGQLEGDRRGDGDAHSDGGTAAAAAEVVGPSPVMNAILRTVPRELGPAEIRALVEGYAAAATRAQTAGFDIVEIMCGGGYLLNRFLSPLTNRRDDAYGGTLENRLRIVLEIVAAIRARTGSALPVMVRLNLAEHMEGGSTPEDALWFARRLEAAGVAGFTSYTGWHESPVPTVQASVPRGGFAHLTKALKRVVTVPVVAANRINSAAVAEEILSQGKADLVGMGRALLADPELPLKARQGREDETVPCIACSNCLTAMLVTYRRPKERATTVCAVNPGLTTPVAPGGSRTGGSHAPKKVMVVGAGPAGLEAARAAAAHGHPVTLFEEADRPGGRLLAAALPPFKDELATLAQALVTRAERAGVEMRFGQAANRVAVEREKPDVLIVALGAEPSVPDLPGIADAKVVPAEGVLRGDVAVSGQVLVMGGGLVGCETAEYAVERLMVVPAPAATAPVTGVTIVEMLDRIAADVPATTRPFLLARLKAAGVRLLTGCRVTGIVPGGATIEDSQGPGFVAADAVVIATGYSIDRQLVGQFDRTAPEVHFVGDCAGGRTIKEAMEQGFAVGGSV